MVWLIFGVIFLIAGLVLCTVFGKKEETNYKEDRYGNYLKDENGNRISEVTYPLRKYSALTAALGVILCIILTFFGCICSVDTGKTGIVTTFGRVENYTLEAGFHTKAPWNKVIQMDNRVQKTTVELPCFSSDIQEVNTIYTVNYQINKTNAQDLYRTVGVDYLDTVIKPAITESVKTIIAHYTAEELIGKRNTLAAEVEEYLGEQLTKYNIEVVSTAIEDMDFTDSFTNAVEAKQVAAQNKLKAEIEQAQAVKQAEADAQVTKTKAVADAEVAQTKARADAEVAKIQANADLDVQKINADAAEYTGRKEAAVVMNRLAGINGWNVKTDNDGNSKLVKSDGTDVTEAERVEGVNKLLEYYYTQAWDGKLPETYVGEENVSSILVNK